ncbi:MAG: bifunctional pyr operon transcriptional regulator/uracil phosphoribosyltransferase PyrR [Desulfosudaceae bacterium]
MSATVPQEFLDAADISRVLSRIAREIIEIHQGVTNLALIGIHTRGVFLAKRLAEEISSIEGRPVLTGDMDITLYRDDWTRISAQPVVRSTTIPFSVDEMHVILVDDVLFTGRTTRAALDALMDFGRPARVELVVLIDRGGRELPIQADYIGKFIKTGSSQMVSVLLTESDDQDRVIIEEAGAGQ